MNKIHSLPPIVAALIIQVFLYLGVGLILPWIQPQLGFVIPLFWVMVVQGCLAAAATFLLGFSYWWVVIQMIAPPLLILGVALNLPVWIFPVLIILLLMVFWNVAVNRVPLYLTNITTADRLVTLLPKKAGLKVADLGSGLGGTLRQMGTQRQQQLFYGFETAPLPFCLSWLLGKFGGNRNVSFHFKSFWKKDLGDYDVIYCFLSPVPMKELYDKAVAEMKPGSLFISNSFTVPGHKPDRTVTVKDGRKTKLMIWKI